MRKSQKIALFISFMFFAGIPFCWWYYLSSSDAFGDIYGMAMAIVICLCVGIAFLTISVASRESAFFPKAITLIGIGVIIYGFWTFSEKSRFAEKPVTKTEAIVTSAYTHSKGCTIEVWYRYQDAAGQWQRGRDYEDGCIPIYNHFADLFIHKGSQIPINYLQAKPAVSRLLPDQHNIVVYLTKALLILIGIIILKCRNSGTGNRIFTAGPFAVAVRLKRKEPQE